MKGLDLDNGRPRVKFGKPQKAFRFNTVRQAANFYLMYSRRREAGIEALEQSLKREYEKIKRDQREGRNTYVVDLT